MEVALLELPLVNACVVITQGEEGHEKHLVAYVVPEHSATQWGGATVTKKEVRAALKKRLPFYMIPSYFIFISRSVLPWRSYIKQCQS